MATNSETSGGTPKENAPTLSELTQEAAKFFKIPIAQLRKELKSSLIKAVANELAAAQVREWQKRNHPGWGPL